MSSATITFPTIKNQFKRTKLVKLLATVVAGAANGVFLAEKDADELSAANTALVEVNKAVKDQAGNVAIRATAAGVAASAMIASEVSATPAAPEAKSEFEIETGIPVPVIVRGGGATKYPFEKLPVGGSFFVPGTEKHPNPAKSLASTINSANKRFKAATPARKFAIRAEEKNGVKGARIYRVEVTA